MQYMLFIVKAGSLISLERTRFDFFKLRKKKNSILILSQKKTQKTDV